MSRTTLEFGTPYPAQRPRLLMVKVIRKMLDTDFLSRFGPRAFALVCHVADQEDRNFYRGPLIDWDKGVRVDIGLSDQEAFTEARAKALRSGFLVYNPPAPKSLQPGTYFVQIPDYARDRTDDAAEPEREADRETPSATPSATPSVHPPVTPSGTPYIKRPITDPSPKTETPPPPSGMESPDGMDAGEEEEFFERETGTQTEPALAELEELARAVGCKFPTSTLREAFRLGATPQHVRSVLEECQRQPVYSVQEPGEPMRMVRRWGGGAVRWRLTNPDLVLLPPGDGWANSPEWAELHARAVEAERRSVAARAAEAEKAEAARQAAEERAKLRQLEIDWEQKYVELTTEEIIRVCQQAGGVIAHPLFLDRVRKNGKPTGKARAQILQAMKDLSGVN
jgi:hypothetical protein